MCGIAGYVYKKSSSKDLSINLIDNIKESLAHRGPNDSGFYIENENNLTLIHTRLSVIDLSSGGKQPMSSSSGRYIICYNGELYNYKDLKRDLSINGHKFVSKSDTEVLLTCIEKWGIEDSLRKFEGMFAFALYDKKLKQLTLVRDRFGEKPLYYGWLKEDFVFGSELKSLKFHKNWEGKINKYSLNQYLKYSYVPNPYSIYKNIFKVPPGSLITFKIEENQCKKIIQNKWFSFEKKINDDSNITYDESKNYLEELLITSVNNQKISDVPIGSLLSGGIDSSLITSLMQRDNSNKINTFTVGYKEKIYDESKYAREISKYIGTNHHEWIINENEILNYIPNINRFYDEPFADSSQLPTLLITKFASQKVTVCLTGDAGDELFGGYNRYTFGPKIYNFINSYPNTAKMISKIITNTRTYNWKTIIDLFQKMIPAKYNLVNPAEKLLKLNEILNCSSEYEVYEKLVSIWKQNILLNENFCDNNIDLSAQFMNRASNFADRMMIEDINTYLTDDILVKVDRASMANSLETRSPFLSEKIALFSQKMPLEMKINSFGQGKRILRDILEKYIPRNLIDRPKAGFGIPIDGWLKTTLKDWALDQLSETKIKNEGIFDYEQIKNVCDLHYEDKINYHHQLWNILMFQSWLDGEKS